jgi:predicted NBD/HSP70 family sugar kinase
VIFAARPVKRLDPKRVTSEVDPVRGLVDDGEGEFAPQVVYRAFPPFEECLKDHFGVAVAAQHVTGTGKL